MENGAEIIKYINETANAIDKKFDDRIEKIFISLNDIKNCINNKAEKTVVENLQTEQIKFQTSLNLLKSLGTLFVGLITLSILVLTFLRG
jgi:hypothetical protein